MANIKQIKIGSTSYDLAATYDKNGKDITSTYAPKSHASTATTYGAGSTTDYGHVKLYQKDDCDSYGEDDGACTPAAVKKAVGQFAPTKTGGGASGSWGISVTGNAATADLLNLHTTTNLSTRKSTWNGSAPSTIKSFPWRQSFLDSSIGSDSGDLVLGLRNGVYVSGGTELCMFIDGDYYSMGKKVYSERDGVVVPGIKKATGISALGWGTNNNYVPDLSMLAFWNGAYSGTASNLSYCSKGAFGTIVTKNAGDYLPLSGGTVTGPLILTHNGDAAGGSGSSPALIVGGAKSGNHLEIDCNEIIAKSNASTQTILYLQDTGGATKACGQFTAGGEIISESANAFRSKFGNYGFFIRNDGSNVYFMLTNPKDSGGNWNDKRPLQISCSTGEVRIGFGATPPVTNAAKVAISYGTVSNAGNCNITADGGIHRNSSSSRLIKEDIEDLKNEELKAELLYNIPVRQFKYKEGILNPNDPRYNKIMPGFIVEEILDIYPIAIDKEEKDIKSWNWGSRYLIPPMLKLIQDQKKEIDELKDEIKELKRIILKEEVK